MLPNPTYVTKKGAMYIGDSLDLIDCLDDSSVNLTVTSPPFALQRKKDYGNKDQDEYVDWLSQFAEKLLPKLKDDGSFVLDIGGAYKKGFPVRSLYNYKVLIKICDGLGYHLAEEFFWYNPSKLPSPIEWVNKRKIRVKDAVNTVWWFSKTEFPKADVRKVLVPYSDRMKKLLDDKDKFYRPQKRPSGHDISDRFGNDMGGAIPSNLLTISNSASNSMYQACCKRHGIKPHPARFPTRLPEFFIKLLTDKNDLVLDIFAGSNTTGEAAERQNRRWIGFENSAEYVAASLFRFVGNEEESIDYYNKIMENNGLPLDLSKTSLA